MKNDLMEICGLTSPDAFPHCEAGCPCTELCETDKLFIPSEKPPMDDLLQTFVKASITSHKIICTPIGEKLVISGCKHIKILYTAKDQCQTVHSALFELPFCTFILLKKTIGKIIDFSTTIEHIDICPLNPRCLYISTIIFMCPVLKNDPPKPPVPKPPSPKSASWIFDDEV